MVAWPRMHLMEWNDQPWLPDVLRRAEIDYLSTVIDAAQPFTPPVPRFAELCARTGADRLIDLCAGSAGPWLRLQPAISSRHCAQPGVIDPTCRPNVQPNVMVPLPHCQKLGSILVHI